MRPMYKVKFYILIMGISLVLTCLTVIVPCSVGGAEDLQALKFGLPFPFIVQESAQTPAGESMPVFASIGSPLENLTSFKPLYFLIDLFVIAQIVLAVYNILKNKKHNNR